MRTWESMWDALLFEAAHLCGEQRSTSSSASSSRYVASIILARASFDAYLSEFIEWRDLPNRLKHARFRDALDGIYKEFSLPPPSFAEGLWSEFSLLNDIRNELVHHKAGRFKPGQSPKSLIERLVSAKVINKPKAIRTWETVISSHATARWACAVAGKSIVHLESISNCHYQRYRSLQIVKERITSILSVISISPTLQQEAGYGSTH